MAKTKHWIEPHPHGIYVRPANIWIDPSRPVKNAVVTYGHADHARSGHGDVWATPETVPIIGLRYGTEAGTALSCPPSAFDSKHRLPRGYVDVVMEWIARIQP